MPSSQLFAVNNLGRVFGLSTGEACWRELDYLGIEFKRLAAHESVVWALGGDHQVYVFVYGSSVPIRVCEESYENQRWNPIEGFTGVLMPSDRCSFSSADGLSKRTLSSITLPTLAWSWESPWHLHHTHEGQALDKEAWTYSIDFPRAYTAEKRWNSCVRRRKWVRYRRYIALDTWSAVPPIHQDATEEPFIDISVGGGEVPGEDPDRLMVWAVTALGRVMVRGGVDGACPEGCRWDHVPTPPDKDVTSVCVGRSGRVWAVTWDGKVIVRTGVTRDCPKGKEWAMVEAPEGSRLQQVAVGTQVMWGVTRDHRVWFRRGLEGAEGAASTTVTGTSWLLMVGGLNSVSVGPSDQVWGVSSEDTLVVVRTGVTPSELAGRTWKPICLPLNTCDTPSHSDGSSSSTSQHSSLSGAGKVTSPQGDTTSAQDVNTPGVENVLNDLSLKGSNEEEGGTQEGGEGVKEFELGEGHGGGRIGGGIQEEPPDPLQNISESSDFPTIEIKYPEYCSSSLESSGMSDHAGEYVASLMASQSSPVKELNALPELPEDSSQKEESTVDRKSVVRQHFPVASKEWSESRLRHASSTSSQGSLVAPREEGPVFKLLPVEDDHLWMWVTGGGCWIKANSMPKWFVSEGSPVHSSEPWRVGVLQRLRQRQEQEIKPFTGYEEAVEGASWAISGQCRWWASKQWVPASVELVMVGSRRSQVKDATLLLHYSLSTPAVEEISVGSILLAAMCVEASMGRSLVALYHPTYPLRPKTLSFSTETEAEEWLNHVTSACKTFRGHNKRPSQYAVWGVTAQGNVYVHDKYMTEEELRLEARVSHKSLAVGEGASSAVLLLDRGFRPGCFVSVLVEIHEGAEQFHVNLQTGRSTESSIAIHINPRFSKKVAVINSKKKSVWGGEEKQGLMSLAPGRQCEVAVMCDDDDFKLSIDEQYWCSFKHRLLPADITHVAVRGEVTINNIMYNHGAGERQLTDWYWRGVGGHFKRVESGACGVTWGISHDCHVYIYTGAEEGGLCKGSSTSESGDHHLSDVRHMYVWENQRWNPVTGFTHRSLPTDRHTWSDQSGRHHRPKDSIRLPSRHWSWVPVSGAWTTTRPAGWTRGGGSTRRTSPSTTTAPLRDDLVRRRRWFRKCRVITSGPWRQMEKVALIDVSVSPVCGSDGTVPVWGVSVTGEVVVRLGVMPHCHRGDSWTLVPAECPMMSVNAGVQTGSVWAVSKDGRAHLRLGVTPGVFQGTQWVNVDSPGHPLVEVASGAGSVWGLDRAGNLHRRTNVLPLFPEGTGWEQACGGVTSFSVDTSGSLWAVLESFSSDSGTVQGVVVRRVGITPYFPLGTAWEATLGTGWSAVCARMCVPSTSPVHDAT
ncbi:Tectonin beta-propeller repeat-containing protein [Chionoecetes opilio]|uniref:Tectonin beta-propeller repeat-containing protein n=1 Tax=Chionoecetes opilio TaxID=41210 RepID=A0A8J4YBF4_CHIOP|nr:Tectonin beta-propeller repeat-containing protein [Chionoecetes opilio]